MWIRDTSRSIRDNILLVLQDRFESSTGSNGFPLWSRVTRHDLTHEDRSLGSAIALLDHKERKTTEINQVISFLHLVCEFSQVTDHRLTDGVPGEDPSSQLNRLLLAIQLTVAVDRTFGGLACDTLEVQSQLDPVASGSLQVEGAVQFQILYSHSLDDPRKLPGEL